MVSTEGRPLTSAPAPNLPHVYLSLGTFGCFSQIRGAATDTSEPMKKLVLITALLGLAACADATKVVNSDVSSARLQSDTAVYFATSKRNVRVGNFKQSVLGTSYKAKVGGRLYDCKYFRGSVTCSAA